jgi:hypothetical protein
MMVAMLAEIFMLRLETTARLMKDALPAGTLCFVAFGPEPQFSAKEIRYRSTEDGRTQVGLSSGL